MKLFELQDHEIDPWHPKVMKAQEIVEWCEENASDFLRNKSPIYRGVSRTRITGLMNTRNLNRKSANTSNHYTLWLDNHHAWANYPKRSASLIASTDIYYADQFGALFVLIPSDNCKIGICPEDDLWASFPTIPRIWGHYEQSGADYFNAILRKEGNVDKSWTDMTVQLKATTAKEVSNVRLQDWMFDNGKSDLYEVMEHIFDPIKSQFALTNAAEFNIENLKHGCEVWVSGDVMQINLNMPHPTVDAFLRKYYKGEQIAVG
jgi:hypothetical protein